MKRILLCFFLLPLSGGSAVLLFHAAHATHTRTRYANMETLVVGGSGVTELAVELYTIRHLGCVWFVWFPVLTVPVPLAQNGRVCVLSTRQCGFDQLSIERRSPFPSEFEVHHTTS